MFSPMLFFYHTLFVYLSSFSSSISQGSSTSLDNFSRYLRYSWDLCSIILLELDYLHLYIPLSPLTAIFYVSYVSSTRNCNLRIVLSFQWGSIGLERYYVVCILVAMSYLVIDEIVLHRRTFSIFWNWSIFIYSQFLFRGLPIYLLWCWKILEIYEICCRFSEGRGLSAQARVYRVSLLGYFWKG